MYYALTISTLAVWFAVAVPSADFTSDVALALPIYLQQGLLESFELQLAGIVVGMLVSYGEFVFSHGLCQKLAACPLWLRFMLIDGGFVVFSLAPIFIMIEAIL